MMDPSFCRGEGFELCDRLLGRLPEVTSAKVSVLDQILGIDSVDESLQRTF